VVEVGAPPAQCTINGVESLELLAQIPDPNNPINLTVRVPAGGKLAERLRKSVAKDLLILAGLLFIEKDDNGKSSPIISPSIICKAVDEQYLNEVVVVGRFSSKSRQTDKTTVRPLAQSRAVRKGDEWEELTDWFPIRGYGSNNGGKSIMDRLHAADKGALAEVCGSLSQMTSKQGDPFIEVRARKLKLHGKSKAGLSSSSNPAKGKDVVGYEQEAYMSSEPDDMPY